MKNQLVAFNGQNLTIHQLNGQDGFTSQDLAKALGYSRADYVNNIYRRHIDEFSKDMVGNVKLTLSGNLITESRVFSLRGCHLVAMFSKTPIAKAFRKWVLDLIERNFSPNIDKPVLVSEHTRALPSPKKEIVLSEKAKQEIGGIVKAVVGAAIKEAEDPLIFAKRKKGMTVKDELKALMREVIREEIADYNLKGGIKETPAFNNAPTANGLPLANWLVGISHAVGSINSIYDQMRKRQVDAVKMLSNQ